jgi:(1->4)-alpha-D-glucan 1-alpha-D-glucosylmutase
VHQWRELNADLIVASGQSRIPTAAHEYMLYQALLGAWPLPGIDARFVERIKGLSSSKPRARESKRRAGSRPTSGTKTALPNLSIAFLDRERSASFIDGFDAFARRVA